MCNLQRITRSFVCRAFLGIFPGILSIQTARSAEPPTYERDVRPILKANCFHCHGEGGHLEGNLDLRLHRLIMQGGDSGPGLVPSNPEESVLFQRVRDLEMPPQEIEKKLTPDEIDTIRRWIEGGAKTLREEPADADPNSYLTEEERSFWAFQPVRRSPLPHISHGELVRTPVDHFIEAKLEANGLTLSPEADKTTLLRRVYFDLLGLPPSVEETEAFLSDDSPDAYEKLVDRLLASPRYGERWGRHWLDVAGYADSEGYHDDDSLRPHAWKYRDYVIRSFNADKPYDRFIVEQLAGDELIGRELTNLNAEETELLTATGYLRMAPDGTASSGVNQNEARNEVVAKTIDIVSTSLMGLTIGCAQCHDHRYDPISQEDYYAMRAVLEPALDWKSWRVPALRRISLYTDEDRKKAADIEAEAKKIEAERLKKQEEFIKQTFEKELAKLDPELHAAIREAHELPPSKRSAEQKKLLQKHPSVNVSAGSLYLYDRKAADELKKMSEEAAKIRSQKPTEEFVRALWEPANRAPPQTFLFARGVPEQPKQVVPPRPPHILAATNPVDFPLDDPSLPTTGRRLAFAKWLTNGQHPLTARVLVNRVWLHHFGRGLVDSPGDFGFLGARPTHPELLDWLASEFMQNDWSIKQLNRLLVTSATYRQLSFRREAAEAIDSENQLYSRMPVRRVEAEVLRDSLLALGDQLNCKSFGPPVPVMADQVGQFVIGIENLDAGRPGAVIPMKGEDLRRSVYVQVRRSRPLSVLDPFDMPRMEPNCTKRSASTVAPQSLLLMNNVFVTESAETLAERILQHSKDDVPRQVQLAWRIIYASEPAPEELARASQFVLELTSHFASNPPSADKGSKPSAKSNKGKAKDASVGDPPDPQLEALTSFCHAMLSSNRFLYID